MNPSDVSSPKRHLKLIRVLHDGVANRTGFSIAETEWDGKPCYGIRWDSSPTTKGYPRGFWGHPQWMIVNGKMIQGMLNALAFCNKA